MNNEVWNTVENLVLRVHRRNGGQLLELDFDLRLLDAGLMLDSLDLAEIVAEVERVFRVSPFEAAEPPATWRAFTQYLVTSGISGVVQTE